MAVRGAWLYCFSSDTCWPRRRLRLPGAQGKGFATKQVQTARVQTDSKENNVWKSHQLWFELVSLLAERSELQPGWNHFSQSQSELVCKAHKQCIRVRIGTLMHTCVSCHTEVNPRLAGINFLHQKPQDASRWSAYSCFICLLNTFDYF